MPLKPLPTNAQDWPRYLRRILLRYVLPFVAAAAVLALLFVPYISRLSFGELRPGAIRNFLFAAVVIGAALFALAVGLSVRLLVNRWIRLLLGDIRARRFLDDAATDSDSAPILKRVRAVMRELEEHQRIEIEFRENWTPQALQQVVREHLDDCAMLVVSNREPYIHRRSAAGDITVQVPASGIVEKAPAADVAQQQADPAVHQQPHRQTHGQCEHRGADHDQADQE
ncbi:MAG TPA: hypothetical protein VMH77_07360, partial [Steroidobacteraceae bacterium]|nr:hypothetical protein [Steroidobacteraceae bacterium]